jgi:hypothetical protein
MTLKEKWQKLAAKTPTPSERTLNFIFYFSALYGLAIAVWALINYLTGNTGIPAFRAVSFALLCKLSVASATLGSQYRKCYDML